MFMAVQKQPVLGADTQPHTHTQRKMSWHKLGTLQAHVDAPRRFITFGAELGGDNIVRVTPSVPT